MYVMHVFHSCLLLLFRCSMFDVFISVYVLVYTQFLVDVVSNIAAFICVGGLVIVVTLAFVYCS